MTPPISFLQLYQAPATGYIPPPPEGVANSTGRLGFGMSSSPYHPEHKWINELKDFMPWHSGYMQENPYAPGVYNIFREASEFEFYSGGTYEIEAGNVITGATSGATATIQIVFLKSGTWAGGDAAGYVRVSVGTHVGTFLPDEQLNVGANTNVANIVRNEYASLCHMNEGLDVNGYPTSMPDIYDGHDAYTAYGFQATEFSQAPQTGLEGRYKFIWEGTADIEVTNRFRPNSIQDVVVGDHWIEFDLVLDVDNGCGITLQMTSLDEEDPPHGMALYRLEYEELYEQGYKVSPRWLDKFPNMKTIRWMDLNGANWGGEGFQTEFPPAHGHGYYNTWEGRPLPTAFSHLWKGISIEEQVAFSNESGADLYTCLPSQALTETYVYPAYPSGLRTDPENYTRPLCEYVRDNLHPDRKFYLEHGNEMWNFFFVQWPWALGEWGADEAWKIEGVTQGSGYEYHGHLARAHMLVAKDVFDGEMERLVRVAAVHTAAYGMDGPQDQFLDGPYSTDALYDGHPPSEEFDVMAITSYWYPGVADPGAGFHAALVDRITSEDPVYTAQEVREWVEQLHYDLIDGTGEITLGYSLWQFQSQANLKAEARDLGLIMYEGGTSLYSQYGYPNPEIYVPFLIEWLNSQEATNVYEHALEVWHSFTPPSAGRGDFMQFCGMNYFDIRTPFFLYSQLEEDHLRGDLMMDYNEGGVIP